MFGLVLSAGPPAAAQDQDIASIDLEPLRTIVGASTIPYRVTVVSDRAIEGTLQIRVDDQNLTYEFPLALAANTEISQLVEIPVEQNDFIGRIVANLIVDGVSVGEDEDFGGDGIARSNFVAGVLGVEVAAAEVQTSPPVGTITNVEIDDLRILSALDIVVSSPAALRTLTADEQSQLLTWVGSGGQLAIADEPGSINDLLPAGWQGPESVILAGVGEINFVGIDWDDAVPPPVSGTTTTSSFIGEFSGDSQALASDAGFQVPSIGLLSLVLLGYLVVIGPLTFGVLGKMNRQALVWFAVPVLAVFFGIVIVGAGRLLVSGRNDAYASVVTVTPAGSHVSSTLLIADDGNQTIDLPQGWSARGNGMGPNSFDGGGGSSQLIISPSRTTTELEFNIDTGSAAVVRVEGRTANAELPFAFTDLEISGDTLTGSVTNQSGVDLFEAAVFVGYNAMYLEQISAGETLPFTIEMQPAGESAFPETIEWDVRLDFRFGFEEPQLDEAEDGVVNGAKWVEWRLDNFGSAVPDGVITAVGWSRELDEFSLVGGEGRTVLVQHAELPTSAEVSSGQIRRTVPRAPSWPDIEGFGREFGEGVPSQFVRPVGSTSDNLAIEISGQVEELAFWVNSEWRYLDLENHDGARTVLIPEAAWSNDRLTAVFGYGGFGGDGNGNAFQPRVVEAGADTASAELLASGERSTRAAEFDDGFQEFDGGFGPEFLDDEVLVDRESRQDLEFEESDMIDGNYDTWSVLLEPGDEVTSTMRSDDFDSQLIVTTEDGGIVTENDDGPNMGLDSRVDFVADEWGIYIFETRALNGFGFGEYSFGVQVESSQPESFTWTAEGNLNPDEVDEWPVSATAGDTVTVTFATEPAPAFQVLDAEGVTVAVEETSAANATFTAGAEGTFSIVLDALGEPGRYEFEVSVVSADE